MVDELPSAYQVWADRDRLEQVFVNLIANAVRHNRDGTTVRLTLNEVASDHQEVCVHVADDGDGMPASAMAYLNGDTDDRAKDQGLGLRLIKGLVAAHNGRVNVSVDSGTTVSITLPVDAIEAQ